VLRPTGQTECITLVTQTDNHASTPPLSFLQAGCPSCHQTNNVKALKANPGVQTGAAVSHLCVCVCVQVAAVLVLRPGASTLDLSDLRSWSAERLPPYQLPSMLRVVDAMPRNAMGKINKKSLVAQLFGNGAGFRAPES